VQTHATSEQAAPASTRAGSGKLRAGVGGRGVLTAGGGARHLIDWQGGLGGSTVFVDVVGFASGRNLVQAYLESSGSPLRSAIEGQILAALKA
jgi:hypothetical protein